MKNKKINFAVVSSLTFMFGVIFLFQSLILTKVVRSAYISRSNDVCTNGRIFIGTDTEEIGDKVYTSHPSVLKPDDDLPHPFQMWYAGYRGDTWRIYNAHSNDALTWNKTNNKTPDESDDSGSDGRIPLSKQETATSSDSTEVSGPSILRERLVICMGEKEIPDYKLWYTGYDQDFATYRIYRAGSFDGLSWNKERHNLVETRCHPGCVDGNCDENCSYLKREGDGGESDPYNIFQVDKCVDSSIRDASVLLDIKKTCTDCKCQPGCIEVDRTYHLWYAGEEGHLGGCPESGDFHASRIYYATSKTGKKGTWEKQGVVLDIKPDGYENLDVLQPAVILEKKYLPTCCDKPDPVKGITESRCEEIDKTFHMWYTGHGKGNEGKESYKIYYATSKDGKSWDRKGVAIDIGEYGKGDNIYVTNPTVVSDTPLALSSHNGPPFRMWYSGYNSATWMIYEATSNDGLHWTKVDNSLPGGGTPPPDEKSDCESCASKSKDDCKDKCAWSETSGGKCLPKAEECKEDLKCEICQNYNEIKDECDKVNEYCTYNTENKKCEKKPDKCTTPADRCQSCENLSSENCKKEEGDKYCKLNTTTNKCEKGEKCANPVNGGCKESNFEGKCSWDPKVMSCICQGESGGDPKRDSGVDKCKSDGTPFSVGLLQVNLTCQYNNPRIPACGTALNPDKKGCANSSCQLEDSNSYNQCKEYFYNADNNISESCTIYKSGGCGGYNCWGAYANCK